MFIDKYDSINNGCNEMNVTFLRNMKEYHKDNRTNKTQNRKENITTILRRKQRTKLSKKQKEYRELNKDTINEKKKKKLSCNICNKMIKKKQYDTNIKEHKH